MYINRGIGCPFKFTLSYSLYVVLEWQVNTEHRTRIRIANPTSFNGSRFEVGTRCAFLIIDVSIALSMERSKV